MTPPAAFADYSIAQITLRCQAGRTPFPRIPWYRKMLVAVLTALKAKHLRHVHPDDAERFLACLLSAAGGDHQECGPGSERPNAPQA
jgi:hypothetical protein